MRSAVMGVYIKEKAVIVHLRLADLSKYSYKLFSIILAPRQKIRVSGGAIALLSPQFK